MIPAGAGHHEMVFEDPKPSGKTPDKQEETTDEGVLTA
jgi:hypothetical protein